MAPRSVASVDKLPNNIALIAHTITPANPEPLII